MSRGGTGGVQDPGISVRGRAWWARRCRDGSEGASEWEGEGEEVRL